MKYILIFLTSICLNIFAMNEWYAYTDNVMGGKSELVAQQNQDVIKLSGTVSTKNNGGFVRLATNPNIASNDIKGIRFLAKGNNEVYDLHVSLKGMKMPPWSFFSKKFSVSDEWSEYQIEFTEFEKYGYSARSFNPKNIRELSFAGYGRDFTVDLELKDIELY
jgi:hypothetical protein